jgi:hypothetical protein
MATNPFKKQSIIDTVVNVGIGGAANVAIDYVVSQVDAIQSLGDTTINAAKIALGAVAGSMVSNKMLRAACDGIATVGVSNLVKGLMDGTSSTETTSGLPYGTISGRVIPGNRAYRRARKVSGVGGAAAGVMGK